MLSGSQDTSCLKSFRCLKQVTNYRAINPRANHAVFSTGHPTDGFHLRHPANAPLNGIQAYMSNFVINLIDLLLYKIHACVTTDLMLLLQPLSMLFERLC